MLHFLVVLWYDKSMKKIFTLILVVLATFIGVNTLTPAPVYAADCTSTAFFALKPWYEGVTDGNCEVKIDKLDGDAAAKFVWTIVLNILYDISVLVGYITIVMIAWGGYLYMFSRGMPDRAEKGKKTLIAAVIGLAVAMLASVIMNTISAILIK